jgi:hypothetical protein
MKKIILKRFKETVKVIESIYQKTLRLIKIIWAWLAQALVETLNQIWTLLGMFAAWLVLEGSAKTTVGYAIITTLTVWLITIQIRKGE